MLSILFITWGVSTAKSNHAGPSAPDRSPKRDVVTPCDRGLISSLPSPPWTSMCCKTQLVCTGDQRERESFIKVSVRSALSTFVASSWTVAVWSLVSLLRPCLYFQTSALFYRFIIFAFGSAGVVLSFCWWKTKHEPLNKEFSSKLKGFIVGFAALC